MNSEDFSFLAAFLKRHSGLAIGIGKKQLVESRLKPLSRRHGFRDVAALLAALRAANVSLVDSVVDAMTTTDSSFFRDQLPFDRFRDTMLPALLASRSRSRRLCIWCAGCAAGQEPYSLAMLIEEIPELDGWSIDIVGTDLSPAAIARARAGLYTQFEVMRGLPVRMLSRHFRPEGTDWRISKRIRERVRFERANLLEPLTAFGSFDVIFCRNVLMYFDSSTKEDVLRRLIGVLADDGYLVLGAMESIIGLSGRLKPLGGGGLYARGAQRLRLRETAMG